MFIDRRQQVSALQALTVTAPSTDVIDLGSLRLIGPGEPMWWVIAARVGLAGTTPTLDIAVQTDDAAVLASSTSRSAMLAACAFRGLADMPR